MFLHSFTHNVEKIRGAMLSDKTPQLRHRSACQQKIIIEHEAKKIIIIIIQNLSITDYIDRSFLTNYEN